MWFSALAGGPGIAQALGMLKHALILVFAALVTGCRPSPLDTGASVHIFSPERSGDTLRFMVLLNAYSDDLSAADCPTFPEPIFINGVELNMTTPVRWEDENYRPRCKPGVWEGDVPLTNDADLVELVIGEGERAQIATIQKFMPAFTLQQVKREVSPGETMQFKVTPVDHFDYYPLPAARFMNYSRSPTTKTPAHVTIEDGELTVVVPETLEVERDHVLELSPVGDFLNSRPIIEAAPSTAIWVFEAYNHSGFTSCDILSQCKSPNLSTFYFGVRVQAP